MRMYRKARAVEERAVHKLAACKAAARQSDTPLRAATTCLNGFAAEEVQAWWSYAFSLFAKYGRYYITENETSAKDQVYPEWWLRSPDVGFTLWHKGGPYHGIPCVEHELPTGTTKPILQVEALSSKHHATESLGRIDWHQFALLLVPMCAISLLSNAISYRVGLRRGAAQSFEDASGYVRVA